MRPTPRILLKKARLPALLVTNLLNIRYLTGCSMTDGILLVLPKGYQLYVDSRYTEYATETALPGVRVLAIGTLKDALQKIRRIGIEADDVTAARERRWKLLFKSTKLVQTSGLVEGFRRKKSPEEIRLLLKARSLTKQLLKEVPTHLKPGITERQLSWMLECRTRELGGQGMSFETIVAFGEHTSRPHHRPTDRALGKGEIVQIDCGVKYRGYCGDLSEVYFTGPATAEQKKVMRLLRKACAEAKKLLRAGVSNRALDKAARDVLKKEKLSDLFLHSLGHGVGLEVHEGVNLSSRAKKTPLEKGEVVTFEPGVYFAGRYGMRIEDMYVVP